MTDHGLVSGAQAAGPAPDRLHLIDKSAWEQRRHQDAARRLDALVEGDLAATSLPIALEVLYSARSHRDFDDQQGFLEALNWLPVTAAVERTAIEVMAKLSRNGHHRLPPPDLMIAATALVHGAVVLHYDSDFERIAGVTDLWHEWIVPRGTGHRSTQSTGTTPA